MSVFSTGCDVRRVGTTPAQSFPLPVFSGGLRSACAFQVHFVSTFGLSGLLEEDAALAHWPNLDESYWFFFYPTFVTSVQKSSMNSKHI